MPKAYELYLQDNDGRRRLHLYACESTEQVMQKARELLEEHDLDSVEVRDAGVHLFSVSR